jgi:hypothetical protein
VLLGSSTRYHKQGKEGRENASERENPAKKKEEALRRRSAPEGDHELHAAMGRMREHHPHLWEALYRAHLAPDADRAKLEEWRGAPEGNREDALATHYDEAKRVLQISLQ